jgi:hypothetical protein
VRDSFAQKVVGIGAIKKENRNQYKYPNILFPGYDIEYHEHDQRRTEQQQNPVSFNKIRKKSNE